MPRILLVEDEPDLLEMLGSLLVGSGYAIVACLSKQEAIAQLQRNAFDLVLADLMVETRRDVQGAWLDLEELVALGRPAPVGVLTAWPVKLEHVKERGAAFLLQKPCSRSTLLTAIAETLHVEPLTEEQRATLRVYFQSIQLGAYDTLASIVTDDVVYELPANDVRFSNVICGRDAFLTFTSETFRTFREPRFELGSITPLPNGAFVEYIGSWRDDSAATRHTMPGTVLFEFRGSQIARIGIRVDPDRWPERSRTPGMRDPDCLA